MGGSDCTSPKKVVHPERRRRDVMQVKSRKKCTAAHQYSNNAVWTRHDICNITFLITLYGQCILRFLRKINFKCQNEIFRYFLDTLLEMALMHFIKVPIGNTFCNLFPIQNSLVYYKYWYFIMIPIKRY